MRIKSLACAALSVFLLAAPTLVSAAVSVSGGVSGDGYSVAGGVSNRGGFFGISWGGGGGGFGIGACSNTICGVGALILFIINQVLVPVLFALAFIMFLYGVAKAYIFSHGEAKAVGEGHKLVLWGVVAFAVMLSLWGLVNVVASTFGLAGFSAPPTPTSY
ncbi:hypothetical protein HYV30_00405 [Candidatus Kaiserbacteria bacterium]|nr:hypothetical protein [Candidatus Kaiserbacteria bacterium]